MADKTELVETETGEIVEYDPTMFPELRWQDPQEATDRFARRFMQATTVDDLFGALEGNSSKNMIGRRLEIKAVEWVAYQADDGVIPNAICTAADLDNGEVIEFATTGRLLTLFIRRAELCGLLPLKVKIAEVTTRSGRKALNFARP